MYTSGCPKIQNRCCHSTGLAARGHVEEVRPEEAGRTAARPAPTVITGKAKASRSCTTSAIHTNTGIRISVMPGARMLRIVTTKFTAETVDAMPGDQQPER